MYQQIGKAIKKEIVVGNMFKVQYVLIHIHDNLEILDEALMFP